MFHRLFAPLLLVVALLVLPATALAQRYPFFIQPIAVEDLRSMSEELGLSPDQVNAVLNMHENYGIRFEELQEGELKNLVDEGLAISQNFVNVSRGSFEIPPRKQVKTLIAAALKVWKAFERIDRQFFNEVRVLLDEDQFDALERLRWRRRADAYRMVHLGAVGEINKGAGANFHQMIRRLELTSLELDAVYPVMRGYERKLVKLCEQLQDDMIEVVDFLLDEIDRRGLREMELMDMMAYFADEERQEELKAIFDEQSRPIQAAAAKLSKLNWGIYEKIRPVLPVDKSLDFQERYFKNVYRGAGSKVFDTRRKIRRILDLPGMTAAQQEQIEVIQDRMNASFESLEPRISKAIEKKRSYRTVSDFEDADGTEAQVRINELGEDARKLGESSLEAVLRLLTTEQRDLFEQKDSDQQTSGVVWSGGGGSGVATEAGTGSRSKHDFPIAAMPQSQALQFAAWVGMPEEELPLVEALHEGYLEDYEVLADAYDTDLEAKYDAMKTDGDGPSWRQRRTSRRELVAIFKERVNDREDRFFDELSLSMPPSVDPTLILMIREAHTRSRTQKALLEADWMLRQRPEAFIELASLVFASDLAMMDDAAQRKLMAAVASYGESAAAIVAAMEEQSRKLQDIQSRLWSGQEYDPSVREKMEKLRGKRRETLGATAQGLTQLNRETMEAMVSLLPDATAWSLREAYDREAYPTIFQAADSMDELIQRILELDTLTPTERQSIESLILDHRSGWREMTDELLTLAKDQSLKVQSWPPKPDTMNAMMKGEQYKYRRSELNDRTRLRLRLLLGEERAATVPGLTGEVDTATSEAQSGVEVEVTIGG